MRDRDIDLVYFTVAAIIALLIGLSFNPCHAEGSPPVPDGMTAMAIETGVRVSWLPVSGVRGFAIHRRALGQEWCWCGSAARDATNWVDTTAAGTHYEYRVRSLGDDDCSDWGAVVAALTVRFAFDPVLYGWRVATDGNAVPESAVKNSPPEVRAGSTVLLDGTAFGDAKGTVTLGAVPLEVLDWKADTIRVKLPAEVPERSEGGLRGSLVIRRADGAVYASLGFTVTR